MSTHIDERTRTRTGGRFEREGQAPEIKPYAGYRTLWLWLLLGWVASGADRTITGPAVTYMKRRAARHDRGLVGGRVLDAGLILASFLLFWFVRERKTTQAA